MEDIKKVMSKPGSNKQKDNKTDYDGKSNNSFTS